MCDVVCVSWQLVMLGVSCGYTTFSTQIQMDLHQDLVLHAMVTKDTISTARSIYVHKSDNFRVSAVVGDCSQHRLIFMLSPTPLTVCPEECTQKDEESSDTICTRIVYRIESIVDENIVTHNHQYSY